MIRYLVPLAAVFALASTAHAQTSQTFSRTYTTSDGRGNSTTTTIEAPATPAGLSAVGMIANQTVYGGFPSYANGIPSYGANCPPTYNYNSGYGYNSGYAGYSAPQGYGYGYSYPAPCPYPAPAPYPYGYAPQAYYVPGQTTYLPHPSFGWNSPPSITTPAQVIVPAYPYGGYAPPYNYGWNTQTTVANGGVTYQQRSANGASLSVRGNILAR